ncbi:hypothetical protein COU60_04305 [Candidatus Pacearchaeota archaeon CG10_big_fil_rev_8_21_14_0_10_34_76]|nr:MAG: hypothetical protein COU60_04305 [Candidatus Pacearchaeota archaeon CG10_big_fil_rev_8_21_14_0_10_34_76]
MAITFKYKSIKRPGGNIVKTPSIPITLHGNSEINIEVIALLDTGADLSVIPQDIAELLNIDLTGEKDKSRGIGGEVNIINTKISINLKKGHESYDFEIPVQVILGDGKIPVILGRKGFFDKFKITFDQANEKVSLKRHTRLNY